MHNFIIYNSKKYYSLQIMFDGMLFISGIYLLFGSLYFIGLIAIIGSLVFTKYHLTEYKNRTPKIVLSHQGINLKNIGFKEWAKIKNCEIIPKSHITGEGIEFYLKITSNDLSGINNLELLTDDLNITQRKLKKLIKEYSNGKVIVN